MLQNRRQPAARWSSDTMPSGKRKKYTPPPDSDVCLVTLQELLPSGRLIPEDQQHRISFDQEGESRTLWCAGDTTLPSRPCVAIVGTRAVSPEGAARARRLARELANAGVVVVSGLAKGIDTEALTAALDSGGKVIAVIGTPLDKAYPAENKELQERIYRDHLLISQFRPGGRVYKTNFPERNKLMAAISDATVIIEASDSSGTLHQAAECKRLSRWLFIAQSVLTDPSVQWTEKFKDLPAVAPLTETSDVLRVLPRN